MATNTGDFKLAGLAAGFTLGFGFLTVWKAVRQTRSIKSPLRSGYIYMVWGEIVANLGIGIVGWLFLEGTIPVGVPVLFSLLFFWVFEIQLLMQIIINRIYVVAENRKTVTQVKWATAVIITAINIAVFCIWIPAHLNPPPAEIYVTINKYWDRTSKVLILVVDAALNFWFLRIVKQRLVRHHGLKKYAPLVQFNARLMVLSIGMDGMLIGLMSLKNQLVYIQFHPVTYIVKLNIEMSMASLITKLARGATTLDDNDLVNPQSSSQNYYHSHSAQNTNSHPLNSMSKRRTGDITKETSIQVTIQEPTQKNRLTGSTTSTSTSSKTARPFYTRTGSDRIQEEDQYPLKDPYNQQNGV